MPVTETIIDFAQLSAKKKHELFDQLWSLDREIFPLSKIEDFYSYLHDLSATSIPIVLYYDKDKLVGQNVIQILKLKVHGKTLYVVSSRAGFLVDYRRRNLSLYSAIRVMLQYKLKHPQHDVWFVPTLMQPKVYMLFACRTRHFYPRMNQTMPESHLELLKFLAQRKEHVESRGQGIYVHPCDLPKITPEQLIRLRRHGDIHVNFFMQYVPDYFSGFGMMCICKLDLKTIIETTFNLISNRKIMN